MKIEKISDTQVKFILTHADLAERDINPGDLSLNSDKIHQFFQDMMRQASDECAFDSENMPLMIEAIPSESDAVIIVVTKITELNGLGENGGKLNLLSLIRAATRLRNALINARQEAEVAVENVSKINAGEQVMSVFSFDDLDIAAAACACINGGYAGESRLYRHEGRYFLVLNYVAAGDPPDIVLYEYGQKHVSNGLSAQFLEERAEVFIRDGAVGKLATYLV